MFTLTRKTQFDDDRIWSVRRRRELLGEQYIFSEVCHDRKKWKKIVTCCRCIGSGHEISD